MSPSSSHLEATAAGGPSMRVIWSACQTYEMDEAYLNGVIARAAQEGVNGIELANRAIDDYIAYRDFPALHAEVDLVALERRQDALRRVVARAEAAGLGFGIWHHEVWGPENLLDRLPELRAADGLLNIEAPLLDHFITAKCREFFDLFPGIRELVLTLTETRHVVAQRPFSSRPASERIRRVLEAVMAATAPAGKKLVLRPFSVVRAEERLVLDAVRTLPPDGVALMHKTEPGDWHPFLPDEPLLGALPQFENRADLDAGSEYYGQSVFPCVYTRHLQKRLEAARGKGASVAVIRVDRGARYPSLGHPVTELNVLAITRWAKNPRRLLEDLWAEWLRERHGFASREIGPLFERTFDVIQHALYLDRHLSGFPDFRIAKKIQTFQLFEAGADLAHLKDHWDKFSERKAPEHAAILAEKEAALRFAREIPADFERLARGMTESSRATILASLKTLEIMAEATLLYARLLMAHTAEIWKLSARAVSSYETEEKAYLDFIEALARARGEEFFHGLPGMMRSVSDGLRAERRLEMPLRARYAETPDLVDVVLCGFASEGHRLATRPRVDRVGRHADRCFRSTGAGPAEGFAYRLKSVPNRRQHLIASFVGDGKPAAGIMRVGSRDFPFALTPFQGFHDREWPLTPSSDAELSVALWSTTPLPCRLATLQLFAR